jgi:hypothetical protein
MEPEGSLPHSQEPATCPYPEHFKKLKIVISDILTVTHKLCALYV